MGASIYKSDGGAAGPLRPTRVHLAQLSPALGDVDRNLADHLAEIDAARKSGANLVVFPELSLTGYFLNDLTEDVAMTLDNPRIVTLAAATAGISAVAGFVERARNQRVYNSSAFIENGRIVHVHRKVYLPTYGIFDESRYFGAGEEFAAFDASFGRVGLLTCEDAWHLGSSYLLFLQNVDLIICSSASPGRGLTESGDVSSLRAWEAVLEAIAALFQTYVIYCNRAGVEDGITFFGGSRVYDPFGIVISKIDGLGAGRGAAELSPGSLRRARLFAPMRRDEKPELILRLLRRIAGEA